MELPPIQALDDLAFLVGGLEFDQLGPVSKLEILTLYAQLEVGEKLAELVEESKAIDTTLSNMAIDVEHVGTWFKLSKLWEGRLT